MNANLIGPELLVFSYKFIKYYENTQINIY